MSHPNKFYKNEEDTHSCTSTEVYTNIMQKNSDNDVCGPQNQKCMSSLKEFSNIRTITFIHFFKKKTKLLHLHYPNLTTFCCITFISHFFLGSSNKMTKKIYKVPYVLHEIWVEIAMHICRVSNFQNSVILKLGRKKH